MDTTTSPDKRRPLGRTQNSLLWLATCGAVLPVCQHLPLALTVGIVALLGYRAWQIRRGGVTPPRSVLLGLLALAAIVLALSLPGDFGVEGGAMLVPVLVTLKQLETRRRRDAYVSVLLIFSCILATFLFSQTMGTMLVAGAAVWLAMSVLTSLNGEAGAWGRPLKVAAVLIAQAVPFMVILFVLFPRNLMPLWTLPPSASRAESGLKEWMSPGSISNLTLSGETAFRVRFTGTAPPTQQLYWRGPVMTDFDGRTWRSEELRPAALPDIDRGKPTVEYELTLEPHNSRWLLGLDMPVSLPSGSFFSQYHQLVSRSPVRTRQRYTAHSVLFADAEAERDALHLRPLLQLPAGGNSRTRQLAVKLREAHPEDAALLRAALNYIATGGFTYTLNPPPLGLNTVDSFLFDSRRGFCEHFASSFVFLMRAAGIPARVVTGYQGGELNPIDGYLVVRQADAHAWAEVWLPGQGWQRVDPTAAAAPIRVLAGVATALPESDQLPFTLRRDIPWMRDLRHQLDAITNGWNQWVLGYSTQSQQKLLSQFGLTQPDWRTLAVASSTLVAIFMTILAVWAARPQRRRNVHTGVWHKLTRKLARRGLPHEPWEGPLAYAERIAQARPELRDDIHQIAKLYSQLRYGVKDSFEARQLRQLKKLIRKFSP